MRFVAFSLGFLSVFLIHVLLIDMRNSYLMLDKVSFYVQQNETIREKNLWIKFYE